MDCPPRWATPRTRRRTLSPEASPEEISRGAYRGTYRSFEALVSDLVRASTEAYEGPRARPGPKGHPPEHYERVAAAYRKALLTIRGRR